MSNPKIIIVMEKSKEITQQGLEEIENALRAEIEQLKMNNEVLTKTKDEYYKFWQQAEADLSLIKEQLKALASLMANIK